MANNKITKQDRQAFAAIIYILFCFLGHGH